MPTAVINLSNGELVKQLVDRGACDEALDWIGDRDLRQAWTECDSLVWMMWYVDFCLPQETQIAYSIEKQCAMSNLNLKHARLGKRPQVWSGDPAAVEYRAKLRGYWDEFIEDTRATFEFVEHTPVQDR